MAKLILLLAPALLGCSAWAFATTGPVTGSAQKARRPATHTITMDATSFNPASLTIVAGDSVVWVNKDVIPHTATSSKAGVFDSGALAAGKTWKHTFKAKGDLAYLCQFHPTMKGRLTVR